jgi:hypothetical protein
MSNNTNPGYENTRNQPHYDDLQQLYFNPWQKRGWKLLRPSFTHMREMALGGKFEPAQFPVLPMDKEKLQNPPKDGVQVI